MIHLPQVPTPPGATSGVIEIRNRSDRHHRSTGYVFRFKQLVVINATYNERTIDYTYDGLSRLQQANYDGGTVEYTYGYDLAGNLTNMNGATRTYNATNQLTNDGTNTLTYDANGNLTNDGTNTYTWDRANRMLSVDNGTLAEKVSYAYDGLGNRVSMSVGTTSPTVTDYLLDVQPGLVKVLAQTTGAATDRFVHSPRGIHAMQDNASDWRYMTQDGLGSVRSEIDEVLMVGAAQHYAPYGEPFGTVGNFDTPFAFTGEQVDSTGQVYLRARYYNPSMGVFPSLDPFEGTMARPMSLNAYSWVEGNVPNMVDPSGMQCESLENRAPGTDGYNPSAWFWCEKLQDTLYSTLQMPSFEEVLYCYSCAMDSGLGTRPEAYEQGLRQAASDGMASAQRIQWAIDEYRNNYTPSTSSGGLQAVYSTLGLNLNGYAEGWATAASALVVSGQAGIELTYDFATFQRMRFIYEGYGGIFGNLLQGLKKLSLEVGASLSNYAGLIKGFTPHKHCGKGDPYTHFTNEYKGTFIVNNVGAALYGGGGGVEFHSPDGSIQGAGLYLSIGSGLDIGYSKVTYRRVYGSEKSYISPVDGKVNVMELTTDILYGRGTISLVADLPLAGDILQGFREEAAMIAEQLAIQYNNSVTTNPCAC